MTLEFWPDYGDGPVWVDGANADLTTLGLDARLIDDLLKWNGLYREDKVPLEGAGDLAWIAEGRVLLRRLREAVEREHTVVVTEPWWGDDPA